MTEYGRNVIDDHDPVAENMSIETDNAESENSAGIHWGVENTEPDILKEPSSEKDMAGVDRQVEVDAVIHLDVETLRQTMLNPRILH